MKHEMLKKKMSFRLWLCSSSPVQKTLGCDWCREENVGRDQKAESE